MPKIKIKRHTCNLLRHAYGHFTVFSSSANVGYSLMLHYIVQLRPPSGNDKYHWQSKTKLNWSQLLEDANGYTWINAVNSWLLIIDLIIGCRPPNTNLESTAECMHSWPKEGRPSLGANTRVNRMSLKGRFTGKIQQLYARAVAWYPWIPVRLCTLTGQLSWLHSRPIATMLFT